MPLQANVEPPPPILPRANSWVSLIEDAHILVVEDSSTQQMILESILQHAGFKHTAFAYAGNDALEKIKSHPFDLVLLDLYLPDIDGLTVCRCIKDLDLPHPPAIILQTCSTDSWHKVQAFEMGASDYISKPFDASELAIRSIIHLERRHLQLQLMEERKNILQELDAAADIQHQLLPTQKQVQRIAERTGVDIASHVQFSSELGGDIWGAEILSPHLFSIYTVDFSGHGLKAAMNTFRLHTLMQKLPPSLPPAILSQLNHQLYDILPTTHFATMFYAVINMMKSTITYSTAGAPLPLIVRGETVVCMEGSGIPLGCKRECEYDKYSLTLMPGDKILIHSDALTEQIPHFTLEDIAAIMIESQGSAQQMLEAILTKAAQHLNSSLLKDDLTLITLKI